jgi:arsenite methyltransferase
MKDDDIKKAVREGYGRIATKGTSCCTPLTSCCKGAPQDMGKKIGYGDDELASVPEGANLGLGCGNPVAMASLKSGETVLDLGSGAGFDCFLASKKVGEKGKVIGVDMTHEMLEKARGNARKGNYTNVEFRLGEIENLPAADNSVDVIISNCVINLTPDKNRVFMEAFRVLRPGGRLMVSDLVLLKELPQVLKNPVESYIGCLSGAIMKEEYLKAIKGAGFKDVGIIDETKYPLELNNVAESVVSIRVKGIKTV